MCGRSACALLHAAPSGVILPHNYPPSRGDLHRSCLLVDCDHARWLTAKLRNSDHHGTTPAMPQASRRDCRSGRSAAMRRSSWSFFVAFLIAFLTLAPVLPASAEQSLSSHGISAADMDLSVDPGVDFYRYANGGWLDRAT